MVLFCRSATILLNLSVIYSDDKLLDINKEYSERIRFHSVISRYPTPFRPIPLNEPHLRGISALNVSKGDNSYLCASAGVSDNLLQIISGSTRQLKGMYNRFLLFRENKAWDNWPDMMFL